MKKRDLIFSTLAIFFFGMAVISISYQNFFYYRIFGDNRHYRDNRHSHDT